MAATFVPFFEKMVSGETAPEYKFNQYKLSKVTLAPSQNRQTRIDKSELRNKAFSDLKNALRLSLPESTIEQILTDAARYHRPGERSLLDESGGGEEGEAEMLSAGDGEGENPSVDLKKEGDKITQITVECVCGREIALDCVY